MKSRPGFFPTLLLTALLLALFPAGLSAQITRDSYPYAIMPMSAQDMGAMLAEQSTWPGIENFPARDRTAATVEYVNFIDHICFRAADRNQASCGSCWLWTGLAILEIAQSVQNGVRVRLSTQHLASCFGGDACCASNLGTVRIFYNTTGYLVPWSNANAEWAYGVNACGTANTTVSCGSIVKNPNYGISGVTTYDVATHGVGAAQAIANIKAVLNQDHAVGFLFYLPDTADWNNFFNFWRWTSADTAWSPNYACGHSAVSGQDGAHFVTCVGYYDDGGSNRYWIMLNSWGASTGHPDGTFRLAMDIDYDCTIKGTDNKNYYIMSWGTIDATFSTQPDISAATTLHSVEPVWPGDSRMLYANVENTGNTAFPNDTVVDFYVDGPNWVGDHYLRQWASKLWESESQWYSVVWHPAADATPGVYRYWARVSNSAVTQVYAPWQGPEEFNVSAGHGSAKIDNLIIFIRPVHTGTTVKLQAQVENTGDYTLSEKDVVWFWVRGPGIDGFVGGAWVGGLKKGEKAWFGIDWAIPLELASGTYSYFAIVYHNLNTTAISEWSSPRNFQVVHSETGDFNWDNLVNALDLNILLNYVNGKLVQGTKPFYAPLAVADINGDGSVNIQDFRALARHLAGRTD